MSKINLMLDNIVFSLQKMGGGSLYWKAITEAASNNNRFNVSFVEREDALGNEVRKEMTIDAPRMADGCRNLRIDEIMPVKVNEPTLFHSSFFRYAVGNECKNITTVHDFICMHQYSGFLKAFSLWQIKRAVHHSDAIICISESTKKDLMRFIPEAANTPIEVIPQGFNSEYSFSQRERLNQAVFIGNRAVKYKNFKRAVEAVNRVPRMKLVIIGAPLTADEEKLLDSLLPGRYVSRVFPSSHEVCDIFNQSKALLYLSEYEGFGIPPLEAMASGLPVIALNKSSIPEVTGNAAILLDAADPDVIATCLAELSKSADLFKHFVACGIERAKGFSWQRTSSCTMRMYEKVWNDSFDCGE